MVFETGPPPRDTRIGLKAHFLTTVDLMLEIGPPPRARGVQNRSPSSFDEAWKGLVELVYKGMSRWEDSLPATSSFSINRAQNHKTLTSVHTNSTLTTPHPLTPLTSSPPWTAQTTLNVATSCPSDAPKMLTSILSLRWAIELSSFRTTETTQPVDCCTTFWSLWSAYTFIWRSFAILLEHGPPALAR